MRVNEHPYIEKSNKPIPLFTGFYIHISPRPIYRTELTQSPRHPTALLHDGSFDRFRQDPEMLSSEELMSTATHRNKTLKQPYSYFDWLFKL
jgi:hypothetical protein